MKVDEISPVKAVKRTGDDALNPYTNPNLDADLSNTIGKNKANRKKIDTNQFLMKSVQEENNEEEDTTHDKTHSYRKKAMSNNIGKQKR